VAQVRESRHRYLMKRLWLATLVKDSHERAALAIALKWRQLHDATLMEQDDINSTPYHRSTALQTLSRRAWNV
jgi:hypothetical protein